VLQISRRVEYALRASIHLSGLGPGETLSFREIGEQQEIPKDFLAKILRTLVDAGIVASVRGSGGGFMLARPACEVSFLDVIEAVEGPVALNECTVNGAGCAWSMQCGMSSVWEQAQGAMLGVLRNTNLSTMRLPDRVLRLEEASE
jgi:Rrf2 family protein